LRPWPALRPLPASAPAARCREPPAARGRRRAASCGGQLLPLVSRHASHHCTRASLQHPSIPPRAPSAVWPPARAASPFPSILVLFLLRPPTRGLGGPRFDPSVPEDRHPVVTRRRRHAVTRSFAPASVAEISVLCTVVARRGALPQWRREHGITRVVGPTAPAARLVFPDRGLRSIWTRAAVARRGQARRARTIWRFRGFPFGR
jgi:hypothetical protein